MTPEQEREIERLNKGRLLRDATVELLPLLNQMREAAISKIALAHRNGEHADLSGYAAEISVIEELRSKITRNNKETAHREEKLNGRPE